LSVSPPVDLTAAATPEQPTPPPVARPNDSADDGNVGGVLHAALRSDLALSPDAARAALLAQFRAIKTRGQAMQYVNAVRDKVNAARGNAL
jgi:hypothetical protein